MPETSKPAARRTFESATHALPGVTLKAVDDSDLERIIARAKSHPSLASAVQDMKQPSREIVLRLIALLKEL